MFTSPFSSGLRVSDKPLFDNVNRIARTLYRFKAYRRITWKAYQRGVPLATLLRTQFPFLLPNADTPPSVTLELTNVCNLKCVYCTSPAGARKRGFMDSKTFHNFLHSVIDSGISRVRVVGDGEPSLHPQFRNFMRELANVVKYVSIVTNAQWKTEDAAHAMLEAPLSLIEVSVDAGGKAAYETSRVGSNFEKLLKNLELLRTTRDALHTSTSINIRLMLRPSQRKFEKIFIKEWNPYADTVMPQYVLQRSGIHTTDVYLPLQEANQTYPKCTTPFKTLDVNWNGDVPLCGLSVIQIGAPGYLLGNINQTSLHKIWNSPAMRDYRAGHRHRKLDLIPMCKGCTGC